jgi:hypothetical protein
MTKQEIEAQFNAAQRKYAQFSQSMPDSIATQKIKEKMESLKAELEAMGAKQAPKIAPVEGKKRGRPAKSKSVSTAKIAPVEGKKRGRPAKITGATQDAEKMSRFLFEKAVKGGKIVDVVLAETLQVANNMVGEGFEFVRQIKQGRSPKTGFIAADSSMTSTTSKKEEVKVAEMTKRGRPSKKMTAEDAGIKIEDSKKRAEKAEKKKTKGRGRPKSTRFFLFEMPLKTSGKFKRKIQAASSIENAKKRLGDSYIFVKEVKASTGEGTFSTSVAGLESFVIEKTPMVATPKADKKNIIVKNLREQTSEISEKPKSIKRDESMPAQLTQAEIRALKAFAQALMKAKFKKGGMTSDDWNDLFSNLTIVRTQFEEEDFEFSDGGFVR